MIKILRSKIGIIFLSMVALLAFCLIVPNSKMLGSFRENNLGILNRSNQKTVLEFKKNQKKYAYVSFDNLYENTTLYYGTKIYQTGHIKKLDMERKYLLVALDGNDSSRIIRLEYHPSNFARDGINLQENDAIKFYGRVLTNDNYMNDKGRTMRRPVVAADFIQRRYEKHHESTII